MLSLGFSQRRKQNDSKEEKRTDDGSGWELAEECVFLDGQLNDAGEAD